MPQNDQLLISSLESLGTLDGPGIRTVFFLQSCPLRCSYCHNPETQADSYLHVPSKDRHMYCPAHSDDGPAGWMDYDKLLSIAKRYKPYYGKKGGITFSGGECLVQAKTLINFIPKLKEEGFNICLDTSGYGASEETLKKLLPMVDYIILDIKAANDEEYRDLCRVPIKGLLRFIKICSDERFFNGKIILRHVCVPGITDDFDSIEDLVTIALPLGDKVISLEVLPYHNHAIPKYDALGLEYRLKDVPEMDVDRAQEYEKKWRELWAKATSRTSNLLPDEVKKTRETNQNDMSIPTESRKEKKLEDSILDHLDRQSGTKDNRQYYNSEIGSELGL